MFGDDWLRHKSWEQQSRAKDLQKKIEKLELHALISGSAELKHEVEGLRREALLGSAFLSTGGGFFNSYAFRGIGIEAKLNEIEKKIKGLSTYSKTQKEDYSSPNYPIRHMPFRKEEPFPEPIASRRAEDLPHREFQNLIDELCNILRKLNKSKKYCTIAQELGKEIDRCVETYFDKEILNRLGEITTGPTHVKAKYVQWLYDIEEKVRIIEQEHKKLGDSDWIYDEWADRDVDDPWD